MCVVDLRCIGFADPGHDAGPRVGFSYVRRIAQSTPSDFGSFELIFADWEKKIRI